MFSKYRRKFAKVIEYQGFIFEEEKQPISIVQLKICLRLVDNWIQNAKFLSKTEFHRKCRSQNLHILIQNWGDKLFSRTGLESVGFEFGRICSESDWNWLRNLGFPILHIFSSFFFFGSFEKGKNWIDPTSRIPPVLRMPLTKSSISLRHISFIHAQHCVCWKKK